MAVALTELATEHTDSQLLDLLPSAGATATEEDESVGSKNLDEQTSPA